MLNLPVGDTYPPSALWEPSMFNAPSSAQRGWVGFIFIGLVFIACCTVLWLAVQEDLLTRQSSRFSVERFAQIKAGMPLAEAVDRLGPPIRSESLPPFPSLDPQGVKLHYFSGDPPSWWPFYTEASVITDYNDIIVRTFFKIEP